MPLVWRTDLQNLLQTPSSDWLGQMQTLWRVQRVIETLFRSRFVCVSSDSRQCLSETPVTCLPFHIEGCSSNSAYLWGLVVPDRLLGGDPEIPVLNTQGFG